MFRIMHKSKIQKATITGTNIDYEGSIGIDAKLIQAADILANEKVQVLNMETGARFETYVIQEQEDSGKICLYGPAAHLGKIGEHVFIISYCLLDEAQAKAVTPRVIYVDKDNKIKQKE